MNSASLLRALINDVILIFLQAYGRMFIGKILHKHLLARNFFSRLPGMAERMKNKISAQAAEASKGQQTVF
jgi:hypothetical protein